MSSHDFSNFRVRGNTPEKANNYPEIQLNSLDEILIIACLFFMLKMGIMKRFAEQALVLTAHAQPN